MTYACPAKEWPYPITLDEFKLFFLREAGVEYQQYPTWVKTVWDKGDFCLEGTVYYKSLIDLNHTAPSVPVMPDEEGKITPIWEALTYNYEDGAAYEKDNIVYFEGRYWQACQNTDSKPGTAPFWVLASPCTIFENARVWETPKAYSEGDKVVAIVNFKPGVWESLMGNNYTNPAVNPPIPDQDPEVLSWEESEDDNIDMEDWILDLDIIRKTTI